MACLLQNGMNFNASKPRRRKSKSGGRGVKENGKPRQPLADASTDQNEQRTFDDSSLDISKPADIATSDVTVDTEDSVQIYSQYMKSITSELLFEAIERDVLFKASPGCTVETLEALVMEYLKADDSPSPATAQEQCYPKKKKRRTADVEVIAAGFIESPSSPKNDRAVGRRKSRRLRNSLSVYKSHGIFGTENSTVADLNEIKWDKDIQQSDDVADMLPGPQQVEDMQFDQLLGSSNGRESNDLRLSDQCSSPPLLNTTFTLDGSSLVDNEDTPITQDVIDLYKNKGEYFQPTPNAFSTIFEVPRKFRGKNIFFSTASNWRSFDFSEENKYYIPQAKRNQRIRKAAKNGYKRPQGSSVTTETVKEALEQLNLSMESET